MDIQLVRLQYEILNTPLKVLAESSGLSEASIKFEAKRSNWKQLWPDLPKISNPSLSGRSAVEAELINEGVSINSEIDEVIATTQKRLQYFSLAKDTYLSVKYAKAESALLDKIQDVIDDCTTIDAIGYAVKAYKGLVDGTSLSSSRSKALQIGDTDGLPLFTMRDMSGVTNAV